VKHIIPAFPRLPIAFTRGKGAWLYDADENAYLDALAGIAVCNLGHCHPNITQTITEQASTLMHTSNCYRIEKQEALAEKLTRLAQLDMAFFTNSGSESTEAAIKLTRLYGHEKGIGVPTILVFEGSFHGRSFGALSASFSSPAHRDGFEPFLPGFVSVPYNDLSAVEAALENNPNIVAVMLEPILGNGGVIVANEGYLCGIRKLCDKHQCLMILDEVQTGIGRTGKLFAYEHENCLPDILNLAKGLGNGFPIGACVATKEVGNLFQPPKHGTTNGGNPLACAVALTVLETIEQDNILENVCQQSQLLLNKLHQRLDHHQNLKEIRGKGLMIGIELNLAIKGIGQTGLEKQLLFNGAGSNTLRLLPPLIINAKETREIAARIEETINAFIDTAVEKS
jgi:acetylornithine/N-succinyldiaminopimelate aminotransferase